MAEKPYGTSLPQCISSTDELEKIITEPDETVVSFMRHMKGDIMILGIGGKIGSDLGIMALKAVQQAKTGAKVYGVSRFSDENKRQRLETYGIHTIPCDLSDPDAVHALQPVEQIIFMAGKKFGASIHKEKTWAMNTIVPAYVASHFKESRIVVFSTGCVYNFTPIVRGGSLEEDQLQPLGEYANSAVGRERVFGYYSQKNGTNMTLLRLNYANDLRYGVLREIGEKVRAEKPIDLTMGHVNIIWQGDVVRMALLSLGICSSPPFCVNITGPETVSVRYIAQMFGKEFAVEPLFVGQEESTALLSNASKAASLFGYPKVPLLTMIKWVAHWLKIGGPSLDAPTYFEKRDGNY